MTSLSSLKDSLGWRLFLWCPEAWALEDHFVVVYGTLSNAISAIIWLTVVVAPLNGAWKCVCVIPGFLTTLVWWTHWAPRPECAPFDTRFKRFVERWHAFIHVFSLTLYLNVWGIAIEVIPDSILPAHITSREIGVLFVFLLAVAFYGAAAGLARKGSDDAQGFASLPIWGYVLILWLDSPYVRCAAVVLCVCAAWWLLRSIQRGESMQFRTAALVWGLLSWIPATFLCLSVIAGSDGYDAQFSKEARTMVAFSSVGVALLLSPAVQSMINRMHNLPAES